MAWNVAGSDELVAWYNDLDEGESDGVDVAVGLWEEYGPLVGRPHADVIRQSRYPNMKELRVQHEGRPYRILFAFDPRRSAYLILGGDKTGDDRWYETAVPKADEIYAKYLDEIGELRPHEDRKETLQGKVSVWHASGENFASSAQPSARPAFRSGFPVRVRVSTTLWPSCARRGTTRRPGWQRCSIGLRMRFRRWSTVPMVTSPRCAATSRPWAGGWR